MSGESTNRTLEDLLEYLRDNRGFDFTGYKRATLERRVSKRMSELNIEKVGDYVDYLQVHPDEFDPLFNTLLINVTSFFRDEQAWEFIAEEIIPKLDAASDGGLMRVWSAGCASGEEAYTLAMLFSEHLGTAGFKERVKIYATDVDEEALLQARQASYTEKAVESVPAELRDRYFERVGPRFVFRPDLRRAVIFGRHDLVQDAPISRIDLLVCRNVLMYFNAEAQAQIVRNLQFALKDTGYLFLGRAEMLLSHPDAFRAVALKNRVFQRVPTDPSERRTASAQVDIQTTSLTEDVAMRDAILRHGFRETVVLDDARRVIFINDAARAFFGLGEPDIGRPFQDLELSYRPIELRSHVEKAYTSRLPVHLADVERQPPDGPTQFLDVHVTPFEYASGGLLGIIIRFEDVTKFKRLQQDLTHANQELETAYEELQSANEELETTNEELQSTVEELETTNEELQSTNEELETTNEELQSTNSEFQAVNEELTHVASEHNSLNQFLGSILSTLETGLAVLDPDFKVVTWNDQTYELWGVRSDEVRGLGFATLDIGLPVLEVLEIARACLRTGSLQEKVIGATNRRGQTMKCRVTCAPLVSDQGQAHGVVITMVETDGKASKRR